MGEFYTSTQYTRGYILAYLYRTDDRADRARGSSISGTLHVISQYVKCIVTLLTGSSRDHRRGSFVLISIGRLPSDKRRAPCQIPCGERIGLSSAAVQRSCRRRSLESFHAHRGPPCCATFAPIAARMSSWLKAAVASGRRRVGNARTQRKGEVIGRALSTLAATPGLLNMLSSQSACTPGAAGLGLHPPTDTAHSPHTPPLAHRTAHGRETPRAKGARSLVRRVPQKKFLP